MTKFDLDAWLREITTPEALTKVHEERHNEVLGRFIEFLQQQLKQRRDTE